MTLGRTVLADCSTGFAFGDPEALGEGDDRPPATLRG